MATLANLIKHSKVLRWNVELRPRQQPDRLLLLLPVLAAHLNDTLSKAGSTWNIEESPTQQLDALTAVFVAGEPLTFGRQFKPLRHYRDGVWYLKTADVRLFGWFPNKDCFIASSIGIAEETKRLQMYRAFGEEVVRHRDQLPLDDPKFVGGNDPNAIVSNFNYP